MGILKQGDVMLNLQLPVLKKKKRKKEAINIGRRVWGLLNLIISLMIGSELFPKGLDLNYLLQSTRIFKDENASFLFFSSRRYRLQIGTSYSPGMKMENKDGS